MASAAVEPIAPVPGFIPGIRPIMLLIRMNRKSEHREREVLLPVLTHDALADIVLDVLDDVLETVDEEALGGPGSASS